MIEVKHIKGVFFLNPFHTVHIVLAAKTIILTDYIFLMSYLLVISLAVRGIVQVQIPRRSSDQAK